MPLSDHFCESDALFDGRWLRALNVADSYTREALVIEVDCGSTHPVRAALWIGDGSGLHLTLSLVLRSGADAGGYPGG